MARRLSETPRRGSAREKPLPSRPAGRPRESGRPNLPTLTRPETPKPGGTAGALSRLRQRVADLEVSLRLAEERLQQITETSLDIICHFRPDGVFTFVSRASLRVLGYAPDEMVGTHFRKYFTAADLASAAALFERAAMGERIELLEVTARHRDGRGVPIEVCAVSLVRDGRVVGIQGIARDVTKRKGAAEGLRLYSERLERLIQEHDSELTSTRESFALRLGRSQAVGRVLREREELLRAAFEQAGIGLGLVGPDGHFLRVNARLAELLGTARDELLDRRWQELTHPDDLDLAVASWNRLCGGEIASSPSERRWVLHDGSYAQTRVLVSAIRTGSSLPSHLMLAVDAVPDERRASAVTAGGAADGR